MTERLPTPEQVDRALRKFDAANWKVKELMPQDCPAWKIKILGMHFKCPKLNYSATDVKAEIIEMRISCESFREDSPICAECPLGKTKGGTLMYL